MLVLALAIGGGAAALVLSRQSKTPVQLAGSSGAAQSRPPRSEPSSKAETGAGSSSSGSADAQAEDTPGSTSSEPPSTESSSGQIPDGSTQQMQSEIQHMLLEWHEDVVSGDYQSAWNLLSQRKQQQSLHKYGYAGWVKNQETLNPYLDPSGLNVAVLGTTPSNGVATVRITGMRWNKPGASCSEWSGITWVKYEGGTWRYDPGYSTSPQREAEWKSRFPELLGGRC